MKTLDQHVIFYDNECPMCNAYTKGFTAAGMLPKDGRAPYQQMPEHYCTLVDRQRAVNEIALINTSTGEVTYGIFSLFKIISNAMPVFGPLFRFAPFIWLMKKFYAFISYNRKVIIPAVANVNSLQPSFRVEYRIAYLLFAWFFTAFILNTYAPLLTGTIPAGSHYREYLVCGGQVFFQALIMQLYRKEKTWDYLGNMMTISFCGALLLLPAYWLSFVVNLPSIVYAGYFMAVAGLMFLEHIRRSKILGLGWLLTLTWVVYRIIVLLIIIN